MTDKEKLKYSEKHISQYHYVHHRSRTLSHGGTKPVAEAISQQITA